KSKFSLQRNPIVLGERGDHFEPVSGRVFLDLCQALLGYIKTYINRLYLVDRDNGLVILLDNIALVNKQVPCASGDRRVNETVCQLEPGIFDGSLISPDRSLQRIGISAH